MGRGNCCVTGEYEGLYYIDNEDFHVYCNDSDEISRFVGELSYDELTGGDWLYDEIATYYEYESIIEDFVNAFIRAFPSFHATDKNQIRRDGCCPLVENKLFLVVTEDNEWSVAVKLLQKNDPYDDHLVGLQKKHYERYFNGMKNCLLNRLPKIGAYSGPWTHSVIHAEDP